MLTRNKKKHKSLKPETFKPLPVNEATGCYKASWVGRGPSKNLFERATIQTDKNVLFTFSLEEENVPVKNFRTMSTMN